VLVRSPSTRRWRDRDVRGQAVAVAALCSLTAAVATQLQTSKNYVEHIARAQKAKASLEMLEVAIALKSSRSSRGHERVPQDHREHLVHRAGRGSTHVAGQPDGELVSRRRWERGTAILLGG
jgi:hypothetical protein